MDQILKDKEILFIGPVFYDYHSIIKRKMEEMGGNITFFAEKKDGLLFGFLNNLNPDLIYKYQELYYASLLKKIKSKRFTHFFLIRGYKIPEFFLQKLKELNPGIEFIMYQWDSNRNNPYFHILKYFDKTSSFDLKDTQERPDIKFLQLFYTDDVAAISGSNTIKYDFFCFSGFTEERYKQTIEFLNFCTENNYTFKVFCFLPKTTYLRLKYLKGLSLKEDFLSYKPMPREEYLKNLAVSDVVVDLNHNTQTGLAMRIIETYGAGKKILTTNTSIVNNPIFSTDWVQIMDINNIEKPIFTNLNHEDRSDLFIDNWLKKLFS